MSGYKKSVMSLKPDCFITFDGDALSDVDGYIRVPFIPDMTSNQNDAYVHSVPEPIKSYSLKTPSLVDRETGIDQNSMVFASRGYLGQVVNTFPYPASKVEIFHSGTLECKDEFTYMFIFQKTENDVWFKGTVYNESNGKYETRPNTYKELKRTIFQKGNDIWCRWRSTATTNYQTLDFKFPGLPTSGSDYTWTYHITNVGSNTNQPVNLINSNNFHSRQIHVTMTRQMLKIGTSLFQTVDRVYFDAILVYEGKGPVTNEPSSGLNTSSIFIGGNGGVVDNFYLNDRQTSPLYMDNFSVWNNKCLTDDEVAWIYKKMYTFDKYTSRWTPQLYIPFSEQTLVPNIDMQDGVISVNQNNVKLQYIGRAGAQVIPGKLGPKRLITSPAVQFQSNGMARVTTTNYTNSVLTVNSNQDYTLEFFVSFTSQKRGVIFSSITDVWPYKGILIEANTQSNVEKRGSIQVTLEDGLFLNTNNVDAFGNPVNYGDGEFHHISVIRRKSVLEFWVDGVLQGSRKANNGTITDNFGQIYLMGSMPDQLSVNGHMSNLSFFTYAMLPHNIRARSYFYVRTVVEGYVTLRGIPHSATVRCYERTTGNFITEGKADPNTGWYKIDVWTQNYMDVVFFDINNPQVRPRALGPYLAYEYTDIDDVFP